MSQVEEASVARLFGVVQNYEWGVKGRASLVAASHAANCKHVPDASASTIPFEIEEDKPYSELWFGTHPNGCSQVIPINPEGVDPLPTSASPVNPRLESLYDWLKRGETSNEGSCPYLFKVLSIAKPLSLQLHPDEENAKALHEAHPDIYRDPYDKPEMAMAISNPFEAFCGFRKLKEIIALANVVPAFGELLKNPLGKIEDTEDEEKCLKTLLNNLYSMPEEIVRERIDSIINSSIYTSLTDEVENEGYWDAAVKTVLSWFGQDQATTNLTVKAHHLFKRLHEAFPYDRGCFAPFFLNYVKLKPGECIFLAPNTIHAYIQGNCLECMKCSDNVVRAGLTPKYQDIDTLRRLVDYRSLSVSHAIVKSYDVTCKIVTSGMAAMVTNKSSLKAYIPPITDSFRYYLLRLTTASKAPDVPLPQWYPLIIFVIHGRVKINQTSSINTGACSYATLGAGSALVVKEWEVIGVDNPSKSWRDGEKLHYVDMMTVDASSLQDGSSTEGDAVVLFVLPNIEPSKLKRSKDSRLPSKKGSVESKETSGASKSINALSPASPTSQSRSGVDMASKEGVDASSASGVNPGTSSAGEVDVNPKEVVPETAQAVAYHAIKTIDGTVSQITAVSAPKPSSNIQGDACEVVKQSVPLVASKDGEHQSAIQASVQSPSSELSSPHDKSTKAASNNVPDLSSVSPKSEMESTSSSQAVASPNVNATSAVASNLANEVKETSRSAISHSSTPETCGRPSEEVAPEVVHAVASHARGSGENLREAAPAQTYAVAARTSGTPKQRVAPAVAHAVREPAEASPKGHAPRSLAPTSADQDVMGGSNIESVALDGDRVPQVLGNMTGSDGELFH